ncbi:HAD family hydrolase [Nocardioides acrostichi]|uniref:HAD-IA family hydrolase n=1 Tax=Nocardioides acrostichi TaxID=2784339 RepID=A0A930UVA9_9ACTN|nr:HAD-IA family hydrolase [Nocardioides acrostichi]MBF4160287.1 HAD-IA family hydrolase [Nocardioides acrostichi]
MTVRHVLLDADGVLQLSPRDPLGVIAAWVGGRERAEELGRQLWAGEKPSLRGEGDFLDVVGEVVPRYGEVDPQEFYDALWGRIEVDEDSLTLARRLKDAGYGVHLGTNQHRQRGTRMRTELGYDDLFDVSCYSWELGVAKPEPAYFDLAVERIGAEPHEVVFVDDVEANVEAARSVGLLGVHWHLDRGHHALRTALAALGVEAAGVTS